MFVLRVASGMILAGWLGRVVARALYRTGVLAGFAIDTEEPRGA
jgi:ABC-type thiamin/hydroxymethylpyrimidine transport system permease subunit